VDHVFIVLPSSSASVDMAKSLDTSCCNNWTIQAIRMKKVRLLGSVETAMWLAAVGQTEF
jgi:hypothetical protein